VKNGERLSSRQIAALKHLAICYANGGLTTLTRDEREAMQPLWRRGTIEMFYRCVSDEGRSGVPFFRPSPSGWNLIRALLAASQRLEKSAA
jgi:hypothetical protein